MSTQVEAASLGTAAVWRDVRRWPWWAQVLAVYGLSRVFLVGVFRWVAGYQLANLWTPAKPSYLDYVATLFDGTWYRQIAESGYPSTLPMVGGVVKQNAWAFYPAYPMLVRAVMQVTGGTWIVVAPLVSTVLGAAAVLLVHRVVAQGAPRAVSAWPGLPLATVALLCAFPTSPVLQAAYTESLALLLIAGALLALVRRAYPWAAVAIGLLGLTRAVALPMTAVVVAHGLSRWLARDDRFRRADQVAVAALAVLAVLSGFFWPWYVGHATGVRDAYLLTQESWRGLRSVAPFIGWTYAPQYFLKGWATPAVIGALLLVVGLFVSRSARRLGAEAYVWAFAYLGYIAAVVEPGTSLARFLLLAFPMGAVSAGLVTGRRARWWWLGGLLVVMLALQVVWVRQIWLFNPAGDWPP